MRNWASRSADRRWGGSCGRWGFGSSRPARSTTPKTRTPSRRSKKLPRHRHRDPHRARLAARRDLVSGRSQDRSEEQADETMGQTGNAPTRSTRPAHEMGLPLRRDLSRQRQGRRAGHALVRHPRHGGAAPDRGLLSARKSVQWTDFSGEGTAARRSCLESGPGFRMTVPRFRRTRKTTIAEHSQTLPVLCVSGNVQLERRLRFVEVTNCPAAAHLLCGLIRKPWCRLSYFCYDGVISLNG